MNLIKNVKGIASVVFVLWSMQGSLLYAACTVTGATGTGGDVVMCSASDTNGYSGTSNGDDITVPSGATVSNTGTNDTLITGNGGDSITVDGGTVTSGGTAINTGNDNDTVIVNGGSVDTSGATVLDNAINTGNGDDAITVNGGSVKNTGGGTTISTGNANDTIIINGGSVEGGRAIDTGNGDDVITVNGGSVSGTGGIAIEGGNNNDTITIGGNVIINGLIRGGPGTDALVFTLAVPKSQFDTIQTALTNANPNNDSITINGLTYSWSDFEDIQVDIVAIAPVPTLGTWSLMLLMVMLGYIGIRISRFSKQ